MPRYRAQFWNRTFLAEFFGALMVVAGIVGYFSAPVWGPLAVALFR